MKSRPSNQNKVLGRTKSPIIVPNSNISTEHKTGTRNKIEASRLGSADMKFRLMSPQSCDKKFIQKRQPLTQEKKKPTTDKTIKTKGKEEQDNTDNTTQQSSCQHLSYVTGEYQLDSYDLFSRRKNVKFQEKVLELEKFPTRNKSNSSRNSSILKNSSRVLDRSMASTEKSLSIHNSFTAVRKCKIGLTSSQENGNSLIRKKYESLIEQLKNCRERRQAGDKYIDQLFPPVEASIFSTSVHRKGHLSKTKDEIVWMRLCQIFPQTCKIFAKGRSLVTISRGQKNYAQNYLVGSMNAIRGCPQLLSFMFQREECNNFGIYLINIFQENSWKYIIVDDLIPCIKKKTKGKQQSLYTPLFLNVTCPQGQSLQLWPFLLEKAYASYYNSYQNLCFGNTIDFLCQLTGSPYKQIQFTGKKMSTELVEKNLSILQNYLSVPSIIGVGWSDQKCLYYPFSILKQNFTGQNIDVGFCDPNNNYNPIKIQISEIPNTFSSVFFYKFKQYPNTTTCPIYPPKMFKDKLKKKQKNKYFEIPSRDTTSLRTFTIFKKTKCCLDLKQKDNRFYWQCGITEYLWTRCIFLQKQYDGGYRWIAGKYTNSKHIIFQETLDPGQYILVVMVEWRQKHNKQLTGTLYSDMDFIKFQRKNYIRQERIIELACMDLAQRLGKLNQINKSICAYTYLCEETALIIQNIVNQRTKGDVTIMRSINGLKSKVQILPINKQFEVDAPQQYGSLEKNQPRKVIGQSVEIDIKKGQSFTVVLRMRDGIDRKFFKVFNFG